jgi:hypothetical protein
MEDFKKFRGSTTPTKSMVYTGTNMIGIVQIPKSNANQYLVSKKLWIQ